MLKSLTFHSKKSFVVSPGDQCFLTLFYKHTTFYLVSNSYFSSFGENRILAAKGTHLKSPETLIIIVTINNVIIFFYFTKLDKRVIKIIQQLLDYYEYFRKAESETFKPKSNQQMFSNFIESVKKERQIYNISSNQRNIFIKGIALLDCYYQNGTLISFADNKSDVT